MLEAADGFGTREIARELDTTPTTVSLWRGRFARQRLDGLEDLPRSGTPPIYSEATDKRIRAVLDRSPPKGFARWNGPLIAKALGDVDVQYVWRSLRNRSRIYRRSGMPYQPSTIIISTCSRTSSRPSSIAANCDGSPNRPLLRRENAFQDCGLITPANSP